MNNIYGMVFTDKTGQVVFVNKHFYQMMGYTPQQDKLVGMPLDKVLQVEAAQARTLAENPPAEMTITPAGRTVELHIRSEPAYDDRRTFIGSNISIVYTEETAANLKAAATSETESVHLEDYFLALLEALQVMLARMGGLNVRAVVDDIVRENATGADLSIEEGRFSWEHMPDVTQQAAFYTGTLHDVLDYAFDVVGAYLVESTIQEVEASLSPNTLTIADKHRLRSLL